MGTPQPTDGVWNISEETPAAYKTFGTKGGVSVTLSIMEGRGNVPAGGRWKWQAVASYGAGRARIGTGAADTPEAAMQAAEARWPELLAEQEEEAHREEQRKAAEERRKAAQIETLLAAIAAVNSDAAETKPAGQT